MCKICIYILIGLCLAVSAYGASMTIVDLPAVGTDAAVPISISMASACECTINYYFQKKGGLSCVGNWFIWL